MPSTPAIQQGEIAASEVLGDTEYTDNVDLERLARDTLTAALHASREQIVAEINDAVPEHVDGYRAEYATAAYNAIVAVMLGEQGPERDS